MASPVISLTDSKLGRMSEPHYDVVDELEMAQSQFDKSRIMLQPVKKIFTTLVVLA